MNTIENEKFNQYVLQEVMEQPNQDIPIHNFKYHSQEDEIQKSAFDRQFLLQMPNQPDTFIEEANPTRQQYSNFEQALPDRNLIDNVIIPTRNLGLPTRLDRSFFK